MSKKKLIIILITLCITKITASSYISYKDSLYFFYERTVYLENLNQFAAAWANPALISKADSISLVTFHSGPLDGNLTLASFRIIFPLGQSTHFSFGATGAGGNQKRLFNATSSGAEYKSKFVFSKPSIELGLSIIQSPILTIGVTNSFGTEQYYYDGFIKNHISEGIHAGVLVSPLPATTLSLATFSNIHFHADTWWSHSIKSGLLFQSSDSIVELAFEYSGALNSTYFTDFLTHYSPSQYKTFKSYLTYKLYETLAIDLGYSTDSFSGNFGIGRVLHLGAQICRNADSHYFGGYEVGASLNRWPSIIHKIFIGYQFEKSK